MSLRKLVDPSSGEASALVTSSIEKSIGKGITSKTSSAIQPQASPGGETDENNELAGPSSSEVEDADSWESGSVDDVPYNREAQNNEELSDEDAVKLQGIQKDIARVELALGTFDFLPLPRPSFPNHLLPLAPFCPPCAPACSC